MKALVETYGCALNEGDGKVIEGILASKGLEITKDIDEADFVFLNTCAVKSVTEARMISRIEELERLRKKLKFDLVVCGCLPRINKKRIQAVSDCRMLDTNSYHRIGDILKGKEKNYFNEVHANKLAFPIAKQGIVAVVPISEGCYGSCTYCAVKNARGTLTSYPIADIKAAVQRMVADGAREIELTSQDTGIYGWDFGANLAELLHEVCAVEGDFKVRVGMMNPAGALRILQPLLDAYDDEKVYKFVHIPIQSGNDRVLHLMKRGYKARDFAELADAFRDRFPDINIATDVIVGFPTETKAEFADTVRIIEQVRPDLTNVSKFTVRPNTEAELMKKLTSQVVKERSVKMAEVAETLGIESNRRYLGKRWRVIALEPAKKSNFIARAPNYKPVILEGATLGQSYDVEIVDAALTHLTGKFV